MENVRIRIRSGEREFEAAGPRDLVEKSLADVREWIFQNSPLLERDRDAKANSVKPISFKNDRLGDVYEINHGQGRIRLRTIPPAKEINEKLSKALLILLFGYQNHFQTVKIPATRLTEDLRLSGFSALKRLSRAFRLLQTGGFAVQNGSGKGTTYQITSPGALKAEAIILDLHSPPDRQN